MCSPSHLCSHHNCVHTAFFTPPFHTAVSQQIGFIRFERFIRFMHFYVLCTLLYALYAVHTFYGLYTLLNALFTKRLLCYSLKV